jgi:hypothetical protein
MSIGRQERISLYLYSTGGLTIAGYVLVNLIREFCNKLVVIVPFKALSTATLITLGADEIIMTPMGQLSPIDPSVEHPLGPQVQLPGQTGGRIAPVNVEDVNAFLDMARDEFKLQSEGSLAEVFATLAKNIHPLTLGAVQRSRQQIAFLASNLMKHHTTNKRRIKKVVGTLSRERFSHSYIIGRSEAESELGLNIVRPEVRLLASIVNLFNEYNDIMRIDTPYNPEALLGTSNQGNFTFNRAIIEVPNSTDVYRTTKEIQRIQMQQPGVPVPVFGFQERLLQDEWLEDNTI